MDVSTVPLDFLKEELCQDFRQRDKYTLPKMFGAREETIGQLWWLPVGLKVACLSLGKSNISVSNVSVIMKSAHYTIHRLFEAAVWVV